MEAVVICRNLKNIVQSGNLLSGKVHSVFKNACNLVIDGDGDDKKFDVDVDDSGTSRSSCKVAAGRFITLLNSNKVMSPMSMVINSNFDFRTLNLKQDMNFEISNFGVLFKEVDMYITMNQAQIWNPECEFSADQLDFKELEKNIKRLEAGLFSKGKFSGIETLVKDLSWQMPELGLSIPVKDDRKQQKDKGLYGENNYGFISDRFRTFIKVYIQGDVERISESCKKIIGFGNGLTPSIDDFINGLMITNVYMGKGNGMIAKDLYVFNKGMVGPSLKKTTRISSEMLKNGVYGLANDAVKQLMMLLLTGKKHKEENSNINEELNLEKYTEFIIDRSIAETSKNSDKYVLDKEIDKAIEAAVDYGETSGTDTALGIYVGLKIWTNYDYRRVMLNEFICRN